LTTPFIQLTCDGTDAPIRQTTSLAGPDDDDDEVPLEPHPEAAAASATAAPTAAADLVKFTADLPFPALHVPKSRPPGGRLRSWRAGWRPASTLVTGLRGVLHLTLRQPSFLACQ
jgi:hypothetical protein